MPHVEARASSRSHDFSIVVDQVGDIGTRSQPAERLDLDQPRGSPVRIASHEQLAPGQPGVGNPSDGVLTAALGPTGEIGNVQPGGDSSQSGIPALFQQRVAHRGGEERLPVTAPTLDVMEPVAHVREHSVDVEHGYAQGRLPHVI